MFRASAFRVAATAARPAGAKAGAAPRLLTQPVQAMVARSYHASIPAREEEVRMRRDPRQRGGVRVDHQICTQPRYVVGARNPTRTTAGLHWVASGPRRTRAGGSSRPPRRTRLSSRPPRPPPDPSLAHARPHPAEGGCGGA